MQCQFDCIDMKFPFYRWGPCKEKFINGSRNSSFNHFIKRFHKFQTIEPCIKRWSIFFIALSQKEHINSSKREKCLRNKKVPSAYSSIKFLVHIKWKIVNLKANTWFILILRNHVMHCWRKFILKKNTINNFIVVHKLYKI